MPAKKNQEERPNQVAEHEIEKAEKANEEGVKEIMELILGLNAVDVMVMTSSSPNVFEEFRHEYQLSIPYYFVDSTVLKAMVRSNPGLILMRNGTVLGKWHYNDVPSAETIYELAGQ